MEGEPADLDEDIQRDDEPVVLWEKYIQQSIIVDLSEDESVHLSDLERSLSFHISKAESAASETSIHLSGSAAFSEYDSSSVSIVSRQSDGVTNKTCNSVLCMSAPRPNTLQDIPSLNMHYEDPGQNTSDEDHEELPYDGDQVAHLLKSDNGQDGSKKSSDVSDFPHLYEHRLILNDASNEQLASTESKPREKACVAENTTAKQDNDLHKPDNDSFLVKQLQLLSKDDLLRSGRLIEAETLPEVSLLESMDETVISKASVHSIMPISSYSDLPSMFEATQSGYSEQKMSIGNENVDFGEPEENNKEATTSTSSKESMGHHFSDEAKEKHQYPKVPLLRTGSFSEMKYGQGQVYYSLPDFSKVAPKVKIPKVPIGPSKPTQQPPSTIHRAHSSPEMLDVVSRVLEDSVLTPEWTCALTNDQDKSPALVQHLQDKYDKLLAKYAEAENLIDQMRLGTNSISELQLCFKEGEDYLAEESLVSPLSRITFVSSDLLTGKMDDKIQTVTKCTDKEADSSVQPEVNPSDGELMTVELTNIISHFMQNVEEFKLNVSNRSISVAEQQMMFRSLMGTQDELERKYMHKKEEHRALEMQNYMGICRNTGTFDPDRLLEGNIFRIGMFLEDIKEMIDKNVCEQISPPQSSSTPQPNTFQIKPKLLLMSTPSPQLSLHEDQNTCFSTVAPEMDEKKQEGTEACAGHVEGQLNYESSQTFLNSCLNPSAENNKEQEEGVSTASDVPGHSDILAYFRATKVSPGAYLSVNESTQDSPLNLECDLGNCVSLSVEDRCCSNEVYKERDNVSESPLKPLRSQRNGNPETDSGFGSSYLNQLTSGSFQQNLNESFNFQNDHISSSDSEGSRSNLQTTIEPAALITAQGTQPSVRLEPHGAANPVKQWVENTTKESLFRLQGAKHHHMSEPILGTTMDTSSSCLYSCSCNNETILALQSEVSRLKKDMEEGLVQLPYLAEKLEYFTSKYSHKSTTILSSRSHQRSIINSPIMSPSIGMTLSNTTSSPVKVDWISTDIDISKNKGTDSEDTFASEVLQFDSSPIGGRGGSDFECLASGLYSPGAMQSSRGPSALAERWFPPLLQVNYGSSSSLPASYKLMEHPLQPSAYGRKRSTQSDTALLPSNVFFQHTLSPLCAHSKLGNRTSRYSGKDEDLHRTLDQAIEVARSMKKTTDHMAKSLSADLVKAKVHRKLYSVQSLRGRKHHAF